MPFKASPEAVDEDAGSPEAGQLYDRRGSELDKRAERHPFEVQAGGADVLAEVAGADLEASFNKRCEELAREQVHLSEIGQTRPAAGQIAVPDERAGVGVAFDAMAFHQDYAVADGFAEVVPGIRGDRHHPSLEREIMRLRHQAARGSERRFCRK